MRLTKVVRVIPLVLVLTPFPSVAQDGTEDELDVDVPGFSARIFPEEALFSPLDIGLVGLTDEAAERPRPWFLIGQFVGTDELSSGGGILGYANALRKAAPGEPDTSLPFSLRFGYQSLNPDGPGDKLEQYSLKYVQTVYKVPKRFALAASAGYKDLVDFKQSYEAALSGEIAVGGPFSLAGDVAWVVEDPEGGGRVDGLAPTVGVGIGGDTIALSVEYAFDLDNEVSAEDLSGAVSFTLPHNMSLLVSVAKDDVVAAQYKLRF